MLFTSYIGKTNPGHTYVAENISGAVTMFINDNPTFRVVESDRENSIVILEDRDGMVAKIWG